ncbi:MAG: FeoA family protein [Candidatus Bathyarchaeia archaeon]
MEVPLVNMGSHRIGYVKRVEGGYGLQKRVCSLGIRVGKPIRIVTAGLFGGPIVVEIDGCRVALGRGVASKIIVEVDG